MTNLISARWQWHSQQGTTCIENRDACGIFESDTYIFCIVIDAAPCGNRGIQFNASWMSTVLDHINDECLTIAAVLSALHAGQKHLRTGRFFTEKASYIAALLPHTGQDAYVFSCGDCSLGVQSSDGSIQWLTQPHTLAHALAELNVDPCSSKRNILTRTLNARRFHTPEILAIPAENFGRWILATDGYRYSEIDEEGHPKDDCSALVIGSNLAVARTSTHTNLLIRARPTANEGDAMPNHNHGAQ